MSELPPGVARYPVVEFDAGNFAIWATVMEEQLKAGLVTMTAQLDWDPGSSEVWTMTVTRTGKKVEDVG